jgi:hypothetical protein
MAIRDNRKRVGVSPVPTERLWSAAEYALWSGRTPQAVAHERCRGGGPPFIKLRKRVYYDPSVVRAWFAQHQVNSTAEMER